MSDDDKALVKQLYEQADQRHGSIGSLCSLEWKAADRIEAQAAEIERLREALHTPLAFIEALHENDPDDQIADNGMTVLDGLKQQALSIIKTIRAALEGKAEQ